MSVSKIINQITDIVVARGDGSFIKNENIGQIQSSLRD